MKPMFFEIDYIILALNEDFDRFRFIVMNTEHNGYSKKLFCMVQYRVHVLLVSSPVSVLTPHFSKF